MELVQEPKDDGSDSRPSVYTEDGRIIFRASAVGGPSHALAAAAAGITPAPFTDRTRQYMAEGNLHEPDIIERVAADGWMMSNVGRDQLELDIPISKRLMVRCHPDGIATATRDHPFAPAGTRCVVEAKAMSRDVFDRWDRRGFDAFHRYAIQLTLEMQGAGLPGLFAVKNRNDGAVRWQVFHEPPVPFAEIRKRLLLIEAGAREGKLNPLDEKCDGMCFVAGTLVLTDQGYKSIETIQVGDLVLTHKGRWRKVLLNGQRMAPLRRVEFSGSPEILTTDEHPFLVRQMRYHHYKSGTPARRVLDVSEWLPAEKIERERSHFGASMGPDALQSEFDVSLWRLVGRFLADGWVVDSSRSVYVCANPAEEKQVERTIEDAGFGWSKKNGRTVAAYRLNAASELFDFLDMFGRYAHGKRLPGFVLSLDRDCAKALLEGYLAGDGHLQKNPKKHNRWLVTTASRELALGMSILIQRVFEVVPTIFYRAAGTWNIEGRSGESKPTWILSIPLRRPHSIMDEGKGWHQIKKNEPLDLVSPVWNLQVEQDESFVAEGMVVHNCQYHFLHDYADADIEPDSIIDGLAEMVDRARERRKQSEELERQAREKLRLALGDRTKVATGFWKVSVSTTKRSRVDTKKMVADGIDLEPYTSWTEVAQMRVSQTQKGRDDG